MACDTHDNPGFSPGSLWDLVRARTAAAIAAGALQSIDTEQIFVPQDGVQFVVRRVSGLAAKRSVRQHDGTGGLADDDRADRTSRDPFLPHDARLFVADVSPTHLCLLNKYNVLAHHLLVVTRAFEPQDTLLSPPDFAALWVCLREGDAFGFYNGGPQAGASQTHRHLQVVSLPLADTGPPLPIAPLLRAAPLDGRVGCIAALPFAHVLARLSLPAGHTPHHAATVLYRVYVELWQRLGHDIRSIPPASADQTASQPQPYNLLITRDWMLLVPRVCDRCDGISINALGFAGALLVRDREELQLVQQRGPMRLLQAVALPPTDKAKPR